MALDKIQNRIVGSGEEPLDQIQFNPRNWRVHPLNQQNALKGVLEEVGWVQQVIVNKRTGNLIDGHLRCQLAAREGAKTIPVVYVDVSEDEEALVLATLDPIGAMAATDREKLNELFQNINSDNEEVQRLIETIAVKNGMIDPVDYEKEWQGMPGFENPDNLGAIKSITVHFETENDIRDFSEIIGQQITPKTIYIWYPKRERENLKAFIADES